jgi:sugar lactone lactonase YvrE
MMNKVFFLVFVLISSSSLISSSFAQTNNEDSNLESLHDAHNILINSIKNDISSFQTSGFTSNVNLPLSAIYVDETLGELVVGLNPTASQSEQYYKEQLQTIVGNDIPIKLVTIVMKNEECLSSTEDDCTPLIGGIGVSRRTTVSDSTLTLPVIKNDDTKGMIASGHVYENFLNYRIYQLGKTIGVVTDIDSLDGRSSDAAFIQADPHIDLKQQIFNPDDVNNPFNVIGAMSSTEHSSGFVAKSGASTGYSFGNIINTGVTILQDHDRPLDGTVETTLFNQVIADYDSFGGDSGSPIFSEAIGNDVYFYGIHVGAACFLEFPLQENDVTIFPREADCNVAGGDYYRVYSPWESIQDELDLKDIDGTFLDIPEWIKDDAGWWAGGSITDDDFKEAMQFLISQGIIDTTKDTATSSTNDIPPWIKNVARYWSDGNIDDRTFANALDYLIVAGVIVITNSISYENLFAVSIQPNNMVTPLVNPIITPSQDQSLSCIPNCFSPSSVMIDSGDTVTFSNTVNYAHTFTSGTASSGPDGIWNEGLIFSGQQREITLHTPGTYTYYSIVKPWMQGTIIVNDPVSPPTSNGGIISALRNIPVSITLSASSIESETLDFIITQNPTSGTLDHTTTVPNDTETSATVTYTSFSSFSGTDSFSFQSRDESGELSDIATITINVTIPDTERPTANQQTVSTQEDQSITITLTGYSPDGNSLDFIVLDGTPAYGGISTVTTINDNSARLVYTPSDDYYGDDTISFRVTDGFKTSGDVDVSIDVIQHVNSAPITSQDTVNIPEDATSYSIDVLSNDYDTDVSFYGDEIFVHSIDTSDTTGGTAVISEDSKSISFTPNQDFDSTTTLSYIARDSVGEQSNPAEITIHMVPSFDSPTSVPDTTTVGVDSVSNTISVLLNDSDPDSGDVLSVASIDSTATRGTAQISSDELSILFTPELNFAGTTTLSYTTKDLAGNTADSATITVEVSPSEGKALYVASGGSGEIIAYNPDGSLLSEHITDGLSSPWGVAISPDGNHIYVSSYTTNKILQYDGATGVLIDSFTNNAESARSNVSVFAQSKQGYTMTASLQPQNELLIANNDISYNTLNQDVSSVLVYDDTTGDYIGEFTREQSLPDGLLVDEYTNSVIITDGTGITHEFVNAAFSGLSSPRSITFGPDGNLYISSANNGEIVKFDVTTNQYDDFATSGLSGNIGLSWGPHDGNLYVSSSGDNKIQKFDDAGNYQSQFIGTGITSPQGLVWGPDGNLYVVSSRNNNISVYDSTANLLRTIGSSSDGLDIPHGITFGPDGNLYVSSFSFSNKILQYDTSGNLLDGAFVGSSNNGGLFDPFDLTFADEPVYNTSPVANNDIIIQHATQGISFNIDANMLLNNDSDADGDTLIIQSVDETSANGGTVSLSGNTIMYTSSDSFTGDDTFSYTVTDGTDYSSASR